MKYSVRIANQSDILFITKLYNEGIEDRIATLETELKTEEYMLDWLNSRSEKYKVLLIEDENNTVHGWASLNVFNSRCCYSGVADISIYISRTMRGKGLGKLLLKSLIQTAKNEGFHKLVLSTFKTNEAGKRLYKSLGFREVGIYEKHGILDGKWIDITIMELILVD